MKLVLEAISEFNANLIPERKIKVLVLDRPNPIYFWHSSGPQLCSEYESFVGSMYVPFVHGQAMGKLACLVNENLEIPLVTLFCINDSDSAIDKYFQDFYVPPSPNLKSIDSVYTYPMTVFIEGTNYSEGRGTDMPFQKIGAPWVNSEELINELGKANLQGVRFDPVKFVPERNEGAYWGPKHEGVECNGILVKIIDRHLVEPMRVAFTLLKTLFHLYPDASKWVKWGEPYGIDLLVGSDQWRKEIDARLKTAY